MNGLTDQAAADLAQKGLSRISALLRGVSGSLASGLAGFVHSSIQKIITGPRMANAWVQVNRAASHALVAVLSGRLVTPQPRTRTGQPVDLRTPARATHRGGRAGRPDLRLLGPADAAVVVAIAILLLIVLGLIELIGRPPAHPSPAPPAPDG